MFHRGLMCWPSIGPIAFSRRKASSKYRQEICRRQPLCEKRRSLPRETVFCLFCFQVCPFSVAVWRRGRPFLQQEWMLGAFAVHPPVHRSIPSHPSIHPCWTVSSKFEAASLSVCSLPPQDINRKRSLPFPLSQPPTSRFPEIRTKFACLLACLFVCLID